jgi:hypothetical protein
MNPRKEIHEHLVIERMRHWLRISRCSLLDIRVPKWRARKNFWALCRRHPELAKRLGLSAISVF